MDAPADHSDNNESNSNAEAGNLSAVLKDVMRMATYAIEVGRLPEQVKFSELYRLWDLKMSQNESLTTEDIDLLEDYYRLLEEELTPVSAVSLFATDVDTKSLNSKEYMNSGAGRHARRMWLMAFLILTFIMAINLFQYVFEMQSGVWALEIKDEFVYVTVLYWLASGLTPFAYGAFGACVRLLRVTEQRLRDRSFDPRRIPEHKNRMVLGTLSGGVIVLLYSSGGVGETDIKITEAALGFLAGYSIDLLFSIIDRLVKALSPGKAVSSDPINEKNKSRKSTPILKSNSSKELKDGATTQPQVTSLKPIPRKP